MSTSFSYFVPTNRPGTAICWRDGCHNTASCDSETDLCREHLRQLQEESVVLEAEATPKRDGETE